MAARLRTGSRVKWKWGSSWAHGRIVERFTEDVVRKIKGSEVTRRATRGEPAFLIRQEDGDEVLKSGSELERDG